LEPTHKLKIVSTTEKQAVYRKKWMAAFLKNSVLCESVCNLILQTAHHSSIQRQTGNNVSRIMAASTKQIADTVTITNQQ